MREASNCKDLVEAVATSDHEGVLILLANSPSRATSSLARSDERFLAELPRPDLRGDTTLHAAGFSYDSEMAWVLLARGADIRAKNRRGAESLHAAAIGDPTSPTWDPVAQRDVIVLLIECGPDPNAISAGGITPLHRAVRNRCSAAVEALLDSGADPTLPNSKGSTAQDLATLTTGRGGSGSAGATAEQRIILDLLTTRGREASQSVCDAWVPGRCLLRREWVTLRDQ